MIPIPRPSIPPGACQECGAPHEGLCHLAEMERNREVPEPIEQVGGQIGYRQGGKDYALPPLVWRKMDGTSTPPVKWRAATAEEIAIAYGMPLWVAERMVAGRCHAGSDAEDDGC
jgi:hypothetical protein